MSSIRYRPTGILNRNTTLGVCERTGARVSTLFCSFSTKSLYSEHYEKNRKFSPFRFHILQENGTETNSYKMYNREIHILMQATDNTQGTPFIYALY